MKNRKKLFIIIVVIAACIIGGVAYGLSRQGNHDTANAKKNASVSSGNESGSTGADSSEASGSGSSTGSDAGAGSAISGIKENDVKSSNDKKTKTKSDIPGEIGNTGLQVTKLGGYSGIYVEDGSNDKVKNVSAILVKNNTGKIIQYAKLKFKVNGTKTATFSFSNLKKGASLLTFEQKRLKYKSDDVYKLKSQTIAYMDKMSLMSDKIGIVTNSNNRMTVTNKTKSEIGSLRIFYKYKNKNGIYIGGITFTTQIKDFAAGKSLTGSPSHFDSKGSEIVMVGEYDE